MSLTASMWTSVSGLLAHGEKMNVIGNNISNVNTVGYRAQRMDFQDFVYQYIGTAAGMGQIGRGTSVGIVMNDFSQGSLETTTSATDIAIQGNGFFCVRPMNNNTKYYTRAGNFTFNKDGYLVDPHNYVLQGWAIDRNNNNADSSVRTNSGIIGTGSPVDICLDTFTCPPRHTTQMTTPINLAYNKVDTVDDKTTDADDPFFALLKAWDATQEKPIGDDKRAYQTTMEVYDEGGRMHKLTIYFDRVAQDNPARVDGYAENESYWEFIVTMDPSEDMRDFDSVYDPTGTSPTNPNVPDKLKGLLAAGTITFSSSGNMKDMSCFVPDSQPSNPNDTWWTGPAGSEVVDLSKWIAAPIGTDGYPMIAPNFSGTAGLQTAYGYDDAGRVLDPTKPNPEASGMLIALDFGISSKSTNWNFLGDSNGNMPGTYVDADGNPINLVTAEGVKRTYITQVEDAKGNYVWQSGSFTATAPSGVTPSGPWTEATPASNATQYTHTFTLGGTGTTPSTLTFANSNATANSNSLTSVAAVPPSNATGFTFTAGVGNFTYTRANVTDPYPTSAQIAAATWTFAAVVGPNDTFTDGNGNTLSVPTGTIVPATGAQLNTFLTANPPGTLTEVGATAWNWNVSDGKTIQTVTTTNNGNPVDGTQTHNSTTSNATEYYWVSTSNPNVKVTTASDTDDPNTVTSWIPQMETVTRSSKYFLNGMDGMATVRENGATTCLGTNFYEHPGAKQDGYTYGDLRYVSVSTDGVLSAAYSNGVTLQLFQLVLYDFPSNQNLRREGGNLFTETRESGVPSSGAAGTGTFGTAHGSSLEQSNADLSREFVNMITTQRGFQANSKTITTVDTMLETVIQMKR